MWLAVRHGMGKAIACQSVLQEVSGHPSPETSITVVGTGSSGSRRRGPGQDRDRARHLRRRTGRTITEQAGRAARQPVMCKHNATVCSLAAWLKTMLTNAGTGTSALSLLRAALSLGELSQDRSGPLPVQGLAHCSNRW
jgi:hypothetical protein